MASVHLIQIALLSILLPLSASESSKANLEVEYFHDVNLTCEIKDDYKNKANVEAWLLPSGTVIDRTKEHLNDNHLRVYNNGTFLEVRKVDDEDFGVYFCVYRASNGDLRVFKTGINVDGPYYSEEMINGYKRKAVIGGIVAGVVFGLIVLTCLLCSVFKHKGKADIEQGLVVSEINIKEAEERREFVENGLQPNKQAGIEQTKIGDNIYDTADGLKNDLLADSIEKQTLIVTAGKDKESIHSDLDHYHSIGSLERDFKPPYDGNSKENDNRSNEIGVQACKNEEERHAHNDDSIATDQSESIVDDKNDDSENTNKTTDVEDVDEENQNNDKSETRSDVSSPEGKEGDEQLIYAKPTKIRRHSSSDKTEGSIIQGEVIIESSGVSVPVTMGPTSSVVTFESTSPLIKENPPKSENVWKSNSMPENEGGILEANEETKEVITATAKETISEAAQLNENQLDKGNDNSSQTSQNECNLTPNVSNDNAEQENKDGAQISENGQIGDKEKKMSSASSLCSEASKSTVDDETIANFENVLASLVHSQRKSSGSSLGNVSDIPEDRDASDPTIEDVQL